MVGETSFSIKKEVQPEARPASSKEIVTPGEDDLEPAQAYAVGDVASSRS